MNLKEHLARRQATAHAAPLPARLGGLAASLFLVFGFAPQAVHAQEVPAQVGIAAQPLSEALIQLANRFSLELAYAPAIVQGLTAPSVSGTMTADQALTRLLAGTGITFRRTGRHVALSRPTPGEAATLEPVVVRGTMDARTEGTGAYTTQGPIGAATPLGLTLKETPQSVSVITNQRMEDQGLTTVQQVLEQVPGIAVPAMGTERVWIMSRGYGIMNYQLDGVNTYSENRGLGASPAQSLTDLALYDHIEVLRGASGLMSGAGDPSGTVNMVRKKPTAEFQGSVEASVGSWDDKRAVLDLSGPLNEAGRVRGRLIAVGQDSDSYLDDYSARKGLLYGVVEADLTDTTRVTAGVEYLNRRSDGASSYLGWPLWFSNGERTDLPRSFNIASRDSYFTTRSTSLFAALEQELSNRWRLKLSANRLRSSQLNDSVILGVYGGHPDALTGDGLNLVAERYAFEQKVDSLDLNVRGPFSLFGRQHELVLGADYQRYNSYTDSSSDLSGLDGSPANIYTWNRIDTGVYGDPDFFVDSSRRQKSLYAAARLELSDKLKFIVGTKVFSYDENYISRSGTGSSSERPASKSSVWTPYGGLVYELDENHTAYASYATIFQPQTARDRTGAALDPREGATYEIGLKSSWLGGGLNTAVALYQIDQKNLSESDPGYFVPGTTTAASRAVEGARTQGVDLEVSGALTPQWNVAASWTYSETRNAEDARITTTFPRHMVKLWTTYRLPGDWNRLTVGGGLNWQSKTYSTVNAWQIGRDMYWEQKPFTVVNLMARYDFNKQLSATLNVNNLLDETYIASVSDWWYAGNYGAPRSASLNMKYQF
ncbi:TonB-dependent siderophore receptor [Castellaniella hirudinis]|uniref:TonB-dependent siderophore receptor n=1 Tax=Castellaniella hirudinis TaxID=1144617 RepID=UPI0039C350E8